MRTRGGNPTGRVASHLLHPRSDLAHAQRWLITTPDQRWLTTTPQRAEVPRLVRVRARRVRGVIISHRLARLVPSARHRGRPATQPCRRRARRWLIAPPRRYGRLGWRGVVAQGGRLLTVRVRARVRVGVRAGVRATARATAVPPAPSWYSGSPTARSQPSCPGSPPGARRLSAARARAGAGAASERGARWRPG